MKRILMAAVAVAILLPMVVSAQTQTVTKVLSWTAPTTGNPAAIYEVQTSADNGATWAAAGTSTTTSKALPLTLLVTVVARVRALDVEGTAGDWSEVSNPYKATLGKPGACGKPTWL